MKLTVNAVWDGVELTKFCLEELKTKNIEALPEDLKLVVTNKAGVEIDVSPDKVKIIFNKT